MKFRKRVKVFPGFTINFSKTGISSTIGVPGASINFGKNGAYLNTGIPGTGLYDRTKIFHSNNSEPDLVLPPEPEPVVDDFTAQDWLKKLNEPQEIKSSSISELTSVSQEIMKEIIEDVYKEKIELKNEFRSVQSQLSSARSAYLIARIFIIGFFVKSFKEKVAILEGYLADLQNQIEKCFINIDIQFDDNFRARYLNMIEAFKKMILSKKIWDVTSSKYNDQFATRSAASQTITRELVGFNIAHIDIIQSEHQALHLENKNGGDIYIYPSFAMVLDASGTFALVDIKDLNIIYYPQQFIETESIPPDSIVVDHTWEKVNKNGQPDRRFRDNRQLPVVEYGKISLNSDTGINEEYQISNVESTKKFAEAYEKFQMTIS